MAVAFRTSILVNSICVVIFLFGFHIFVAVGFDDVPANLQEAENSPANSACEKKLQMLEQEVLGFCESEQEGLNNGKYKWLTHVRGVDAMEMTQSVMHALRWGRRDESHGLLFTKRAFHEKKSTLLLWSGVSASSHEKWCQDVPVFICMSCY